MEVIAQQQLASAHADYVPASLDSCAAPSATADTLPEVQGAAGESNPMLCFNMAFTACGAPRVMFVAPCGVGSTNFQHETRLGGQLWAKTRFCLQKLENFEGRLVFWGGGEAGIKNPYLPESAGTRDRRDTVAVLGLVLGGRLYGVFSQVRIAGQTLRSG